MANIGSLVANLALESAAFRRDLTKATSDISSNTAKMRQSMKRVETATRNLNRQFRGLRAAAGALAGALAVRQFTQFTRSAIDSASAIKDVADKVGFTTTQLQQLRFAAEQTNVAQTALDMGLQRFSRRLGEAAQDTGELQGIIEQYGVAVFDAEGRMRSNIDVLGDFAEVIKNAESEQERLRVAFKLFDSEGAALVNTLRNGRVGMEEFMQQAIDFGVVMDDNVIARAKIAGDNLSALTRVFKTAFDTSIIEGFAGSLTLTQDRIESVQATGRRFGQLVGASMRGVASAAEFVSRNMREVVTAMAALIALKAASVVSGVAVALGALAVAAARGGRAMFLASLATRANIKGLIVLAATVAAAAAAWESFEDSIGGELTSLIDDATSAMSDFTGAAVDGADEVIATFGEMKSELIVARNNAVALAQAQAEGAVSLARVNREMELFNLEQRLGVTFTQQQRDELALLIQERENFLAQQQDIIDQQAAEARAVEEAAEAQARAQEEMQEDLRRRAEENERIFQQPFINAIESVQRVFSDTFVNIFEGGVKSFGDLAAAAKQIFLRLAAEVATLLIFRPQVLSAAGSVAGVPGLQNSAGGGLGGLLGGGGGPLSFASDIGSGINSFGSLLGFSSGAGGSTFGGGAFAAGVAGPPAVPTGILGGTTFSTFLGGAGLGFGAGTFANSLAGGNQTGGQIGAAGGAIAGAVIGSVVPVIGTVIGGLVGGTAGGLIGGLFGGGKKTPGAVQRIELSTTGDLVLGGSSTIGGADLAGVQAEAQKAIEFLNTLKNQLDLTFSGNLQSLFQGNNFIGFGKDTGGAFQDAGSFINSFLGRGGLVSDNANLTKILTGSSASQLVDNIELFARVPGLLGPVTTAFEQAMKQITDDFDLMAEKAGKFGIATDLIVAAREREIAALEAQARAPFMAAGGQIVDFLNAQSLNGGSTLNPVARLTEAQRQFGDLLERVRGGEVGLTGNLTSAAGTLLGIGRENFASSVSFANLESSVRSSLLNVGEQITSQEFFEEQQTEAVRQQTEVLSGDIQDNTAAVEALKREFQLLRQQLAA